MNVTWMFHDEESRDRIAKRIQALKVEDGEVFQVQIMHYQPRRGEQANRRLWALHKVAAAETGHSTEEMHDLMCWKFLPRRQIKVLGEEVEVRGQSSKLTKKEFADFMTRVEEFYISELGVFLDEVPA